MATSLCRRLATSILTRVWPNIRPSRPSQFRWPSLPDRVAAMPPSRRRMLRLWKQPLPCARPNPCPQSQTLAQAILQSNRSIGWPGVFHSLSWLASSFGVAGNSTGPTTQIASDLRRRRRRPIRPCLKRKKRVWDAYSAANDVLNTYISDKLNQPVSGLTHQSLVHTLSQHGIRADLVARVDTALTVSEWRSFSPGERDDAGGQEHLKEVDSLIGDLEKAF